MPASLIFDSVTVLPPEARGHAVLAASHGGDYAAYLAAKAGVKAVILCDAGVGRERAGIGGLAYLEALGVAAATIGHRSARIGDGADCAARGVISFVNARATAVGVTAGMTARETLERLERADLPGSPTPPPMHEARHEIGTSAASRVRIHALDSNALVTPDDVGHIIVTGSHGALLGGRPATAVKVEVFAALYNDADFGIDDAGISRLPALDARGIAGATVSAWSARIGDGQSTYRDGFITAVNARAAQCGGEVGISAIELVARLVAARMKDLKA
ncbi:MAG TPA: hypothetical protein VFB45_27115 [Pseudolabrys sp.]|nr:hypothetical protein [Pseudolabrys sp.]